jgi:hypothetical protein
MMAERATLKGAYSMKVFISWSGERSKPIAAAIREWLPDMLQYVKPYFTPADIEKGAKWDQEISKELRESSVCIIALTPECLDSKWIMFEGGLRHRSQRSRRRSSIDQGGGKRRLPICFDPDQCDDALPEISFTQRSGRPKSGD